MSLAGRVGQLGGELLGEDGVEGQHDPQYVAFTGLVHRSLAPDIYLLGGRGGEEREKRKGRREKDRRREVR